MHKIIKTLLLTTTLLSTLAYAAQNPLAAASTTTQALSPTDLQSIEEQFTDLANFAKLDQLITSKNQFTNGFQNKP